MYNENKPKPAKVFSPEFPILVFDDFQHAIEWRNHWYSDANQGARPVIDRCGQYPLALSLKGSYDALEGVWYVKAPTSPANRRTLVNRGAIEEGYLHPRPGQWKQACDAPKQACDAPKQACDAPKQDTEAPDGFVVEYGDDHEYVTVRARRTKTVYTCPSGSTFDEGDVPASASGILALTKQSGRKLPFYISTFLEALTNPSKI